MKKGRKLSLFASVCAMFLFGVVLASCTDKEKGEACKHTWQANEPADRVCMEYVETIYTCADCGETYSSSKVWGHVMANGECTVCEAKESEGLEIRLVYKNPQDMLSETNPLYAVVAGIGMCTDTEIIIPAIAENLPVLKIDDRAFSNVQQIKSVYADVETIGTDAFLSCRQLKTIALSDKVKEVSAGAFTDTAYYNTEENWSDKTLYIDDILITSKKAGEYRVKEGTRVIAENAFYGQTEGSLTKLILPDSLAHIGEGAFAHNGKLTEVVIGENVKSIGKDIFFESAYEDDEKNWENDALYLGTYLLDVRKNEAWEYQVLDGTTLIANYAFVGFYTLSSLSLPNSLQYVNEQAFVNNPKLVSIYNPANVELPTALTESALQIFNDPEEKRISLENGFILYKENDECILLGCVEEFTELIVPDGVTEIGKYAFERTNTLLSVTIPESVKKIGENAFEMCKQLKEVTFAQGLTRIENYAFANCDLRKIAFPAEMEWIGLCAFDNNENLAEVDFPASVYFIAPGAFRSCSSLQTAIFEKTTDWVCSWSDGEWRYYGHITDLSSYENLISELKDIHGKYSFLQKEKIEEIYPGERIPA